MKKYKKIFFIMVGFFLVSCNSKKTDFFDIDSNPEVEKKYLEELNFQKRVLIPKKIHQIWVGSEKAPKYFDLYLESFKKNAPGYEYKLWKNADLTEENFPITFPFILKIVEAGIERYGRNNKMWKGIPTKKIAQIADLMRLEIIYRHGGFYYDVKTELLKSPGEIETSGISFVLSNEDPCGFECKNNSGFYLSNSFFGAVPKSTILKVLLEEKNLEEINFQNESVNEETGPYYLTKGFSSKVKKAPSKYGVLMLETNKAYPYISWSSPYRGSEKDKCVSTESGKLIAGPGQKVEPVIHNNKETYILLPCDKYPGAMSIQHWVLGGSWL